MRRQVNKTRRADDKGEISDAAAEANSYDSVTIWGRSRRKPPQIPDLGIALPPDGRGSFLNSGVNAEGDPSATSTQPRPDQFKPPAWAREDTRADGSSQIVGRR